VSLRVLQAKLKEAAQKGWATRELMELAGITRVTGYVADEKRRDLILVGEVEKGAPALHTGDLAVALRSAWYKYAKRRGNTIYYEDPGCSIDPDPAVIRRLSEVGQVAVNEKTMDQWCEICDERQKVRVMGAPFDSRFAKVMVDADYLMKRLVNGSLQMYIPGFESLSDMRSRRWRKALETGNSIAGGLSMNRFWFYPGDAQFREQDGVVRIDACPVTLLTEEQHLTREGLTGLKRPDPMAQQFAENFSQHYAEIAEGKLIYQELEGLFRFAALAKLVKYDKPRVDLDFLMDRFPVTTVKVARTLPGISRVTTIEREREVAGGYQIATVWMPSCGGVNMGFKIGPHNFKRVRPSGGGAAKGGRRQAPAQPAGPGGLGGKFPRQQRAGGAGSKAPKQQKPAPKKSDILKARPAPDALSWDMGPDVRWH
jgi:hypothetical protein